jgi:hypothetical protein
MYIIKINKRVLHAGPNLKDLIENARLDVGDFIEGAESVDTDPEAARLRAPLGFFQPLGFYLPGSKALRDTIKWARGRYSWGDLAVPDEEDLPILDLEDAREWRNACLSDTEGDHSLFPCLNLGSKTGAEITRLFDRIGEW